MVILLYKMIFVGHVCLENLILENGQRSFFFLCTLFLEWYNSLKIAAILAKNIFLHHFAKL